MLSNEEFTDQILRTMQKYSDGLYSFKNARANGNTDYMRALMQRATSYKKFIKRFIAKHREEPSYKQSEYLDEISKMIIREVK